MYNNVRNPGASMVAHPIFPGMLKRDSMDVLPIGYHAVTNCTDVS